MKDKKECELRSYFQDGDRWENEIVLRAKRSSTMAWFVTSILMLTTILAVISLLLLVPLKSFEPVIVTVDKSTGYIETKSGLTQSSNLTKSHAVSQANVVRYIRTREGYDPYAISDNYGIAALLSTGTAAKDLEDEYSPTNINSPPKIYGKETRVLVEIKSVTFPNDSTALVRFATTTKSNAGSVIKNYISVVRYQYTNEPETNSWRFDNPLGFQVYSYRRDQETVTEGDIHE